MIIDPLTGFNGKNHDDDEGRDDHEVQTRAIAWMKTELAH